VRRSAAAVTVDGSVATTLAETVAVTGRLTGDAAASAQAGVLESGARRQSFIRQPVITAILGSVRRSRIRSADRAF